MNQHNLERVAKSWLKRRQFQREESLGLIDVNSATSDQLKTLPEIGDVYTEKIIKGSFLRYEHPVEIQEDHSHAENSYHLK